MILKCDCIGCQNIRKFARPKSCFEYKKSVKPECNENCIPKENVYKNFERDVNTSDIYRTVNIPDRFERSCEFAHTQIATIFYFHFVLIFSADLIPD